MADDDLEEIDDDGDPAEGMDDDDEESSGGGGGKKKLIIIIVLLLVVIGGIAGAYFSGMLQPVVDMISGGEKEEVAVEGEAAHDAFFYDMPELLVNLNTGSRKPTYLKIRVSLELEKAEDQPRVEILMPRIIDNFQVYLRELRIDDLKGSAGMYRLREELLARVNVAVAPTRINDVLFKEMLVQ